MNHFLLLKAIQALFGHLCQGLVDTDRNGSCPCPLAADGQAVHPEDVPAPYPSTAHSGLIRAT